MTTQQHTRWATAIFATAWLLPGCATPPSADCPNRPDQAQGDESASAAVAEPQEGEEAEEADTSPVELIVCHPESVHEYTADTHTTGESFACSLYDRGGISQLLEADVAGVEYGSLTEAMSHEHVEGTVEYIYIYDRSTLDWLSEDDRSALGSAFEAGAPVGLGGTDEAALTQALGLPEGQAGVLPDARAAHFVHRSGGAVEHLAVELAYQDNFGQVLSEVMDWEETNHGSATSTATATQSATLDRPANTLLGYMPSSTAWEFPTQALRSSVSVDDGWHYCKSYSYSGKINDGDSDRGGYNMRFKFSYVPREEVEDDLDRWLVISEMTSSMSNYYNEDGNKHKGWYMRGMQLKATLGQYSGDIDEWSPSTTVGSRSTTSTIGGGISSSGPDANYSVATTNSTDDVSIEVDGDLSNNDGVNGKDWAQWSVTFARAGTNSTDTKLKDPSAAGQGIWKEAFALYTINEDDGEGINVVLRPYFRVEHSRCGSSCPIRKSTTYYPFGTSGRTFQVFEDTCD